MRSPSDFFPHLVNIASNAVRLVIAVQFGAMRSLHHRFSEYLCSGLIPNRSTFCIGSPFIAGFCFFITRRSATVFVLFIVVFECILLE